METGRLPTRGPAGSRKPQQRVSGLHGVGGPMRPPSPRAWTPRTRKGTSPGCGEGPRQAALAPCSGSPDPSPHPDPQSRPSDRPAPVRPAPAPGWRVLPSADQARLWPLPGCSGKGAPQAVVPLEPTMPVSRGSGHHDRSTGGPTRPPSAASGGRWAGGGSWVTPTPGPFPWPEPHAGCRGPAPGSYPAHSSCTRSRPAPGR